MTAHIRLLVMLACVAAGMPACAVGRGSVTIAPVLVPGGTLVLGAWRADVQPVYIDRYEVSVRDYRACVRADDGVEADDTLTVTRMENPQGDEMTESEWDALRVHLEELRPLMEAFCRQFLFSPVDPATLGRYPRLRIERGGEVKIWFDLWMELDRDGRYHTEFRPDLPYELSAGACFETAEASERVRYQYSMACFVGVPFFEVAARLVPAMTQSLPAIAAIDCTWLLAQGKRVVLSGAP